VYLVNSVIKGVLFLVFLTKENSSSLSFEVSIYIENESLIDGVIQAIKHHRGRKWLMTIHETCNYYV